MRKGTSAGTMARNPGDTVKRARADSHLCAHNTSAPPLLLTAGKQEGERDTCAAVLTNTRGP